MKFEENPPDAASLMTSARSFGNYDLPGALADLIDNSIKADAHEVALTCEFAGGAPEIRIRDDGHGMSATELRQAMRPASANPLTERSPDDLGRFGWGMKSASFSGMPAGQPSMTTPNAGPCDSPKVVMRNNVPKLLLAMLAEGMEQREEEIIVVGAAGK